MLEKTFRMTFFLKNKKNHSDDTKHIFLRLTVNGLTRELSTKIDWNKSRWNTRLGMASGSKEDARQVNAYLESIKLKVLEAKQKLLEKGQVIHVDNIRRILLGEGEENYYLLKVFDDHNKKMANLVGIEYASGTLERYLTARKHTLDYIKWKYRMEDLQIKTLNHEFIADFEYWFKTIRKCSHNTTIKYLTNLKKIVLLCVKNGWLPKDPFLNYRLVKKEVNREALTELELERIWRRVFPTERLNQIKDIFIFSCYTGLAYVDVKNLKKEHLITGIDGELWLVTHRQKTNSPTRIPLLPEALEILKKYKKHPRVEQSEILLPVPSNQKVNAYLKEIGDLCGINKELTFHIARHTFATTITLANGVPIETVSKLLGHKSLAQTQHYAKILDIKISQEMGMLREKLSKKETGSKTFSGKKPRF